jgi:pilus assembly protein CpaE
MPELSVVVVAPDSEQRAVLQVLVDGTSIARTVHAASAFPVAASDPVLKRVQSLKAEVVLVDIPADSPGPAIRTIELLRQEVPGLAVFAIGSMNQSQVIVNAMRAGAQEFIPRPTSTSDMLEAFVRLSAAQRRVSGENQRGRVFIFVNAKGGSGATTIAAHLAMALQASHGHCVLVDLAPLGHAALHLGLKPAFSVTDALQNLHRLDSSLLEGYMTRHGEGLQLLAGASAPSIPEPSTSEFARLFDMLVTHYKYVVVDASTRLDAVTRLVCNLAETVLLVAQADVASLWSAGKVMQYLGDTGGGERVRLILNRFHRIPGFSERDAETAAGAKLMWKVPNQYQAISLAIDRGAPVNHRTQSELARCFADFAAALSQGHAEPKRSPWHLFRTVEKS